MGIIILLLLHIVSDFYLQTGNVAVKKKMQIRYLLLHAGIYAVPFLLYAIFMLLYDGVTTGFTTFPLVVSSHFLIDLIKGKAEKKYPGSLAELVIFVSDQILHVAVLVTTGSCFPLETAAANAVIPFAGANVSARNGIIYSFMLLLIGMPASVLVQKVFQAMEVPAEKSENCASGAEQPTEASAGLSAGTMIGVPERFITMILIIVNQYGVLGLVLTAKSIARFKKFDEKGFAEKYLPGTLLSLAVAIVVSLLLKNY